MEEEVGNKSFHSLTETITKSGKIQCVKYMQQNCMTLCVPGGPEPGRSLSCEPDYVPDTDIKMTNSTDVVYTFTMPAV